MPAWMLLSWESFQRAKVSHLSLCDAGTGKEFDRLCRNPTRLASLNVRLVMTRSAWPTLAGTTLVIVILGLLWRTVRYALAFPLWGDEAYVAVNILTRDLAGLSQPLEFFQIVPPGFLWVEWFVVHGLGSGERALRLVPYLAGVTSLLLFWRFCREVSTRRATLVAVAVLAASFYPVRHANEVKPYATDLLISLALTSLGWSTWRHVRSYRHWAALSAATTAGIWCSYTAIFPAAAVTLLLGARAIRERSIRLVILWLACSLLMVLNWGVMYLGFAAPQARAAPFLTNLFTWRKAFPPLTEPGRLLWWLIDTHAGQMMAYPHGGHDFGSVLTALLVIAGCVRMGRRRVRRPLLFLLVAPLAPAMVAAALHRYPYGTSTRVMLYMAPAFCLLMGEGIIAALRHRHWIRYGPIVVAGVLAVVTLTFTARDLAKPYSSKDNVDHQRLARLVASRAGPGDQLIVFNSVTPPPPISDLMITRWLQRVAEVRFYLLSYASVPLRWEPDPETVIPGPGGNLWLIIQRHGNQRFFSEDRLAAYQRDLEKRFGPPRIAARYSLSNNESWCVCVYTPASQPDHLLKSLGMSDTMASMSLSDNAPL